MAFDDFDDFDSPLGSTGGRRFPTVKFDQPGDRFVGVVVDYDDAAPLFVYGTQERKVTPNGKEQTKDVLTVLLMKGTTAHVTDPDGTDAAPYISPENIEGTVAKVHIQGHNRWTPDQRPDGMRPAWRNAIEAAGGAFRRGAVVLGQFEATTRIGHGGAKLSQDKKLIGFAIRAAKPEEEAHLQQLAREAYRELKRSPEPAYVPAAARPADDLDDAF